MFTLYLFTAFTQLLKFTNIIQRMKQMFMHVTPAPFFISNSTNLITIQKYNQNCWHQKSINGEIA